MEQSADSQGGGLQEMKNTLRYMLYLPKPPDEATIERYKTHLANKVDQNDLDKMNLEVSKKFCGLSGRHKFDQDIEDEWFIVFILYELSKFDEDVVIRVADEYGDLLLIEAADHLPRWLESKRSRNRTFIHKGALHIIPEQINLRRLIGPGGKQCTLREKAANFVREINKSARNMDDERHPVVSLYQGNIPKDVKTQASEKIQRAIIDQLTGLPDKRAWLSKKFAQLDDIITDRGGASGRRDSVQVEQELEKNFKENLTLASIKAMDDKDLDISPMSSVGTSRSSSPASSWLSEQDNEDNQFEAS